MKGLLVKALWVLHWLLAWMQLLGSFALPVKYLPSYIVALSLCLIDWYDLDEGCWATVLRDILEDNKSKPGFIASQTGLDRELVHKVLVVVVSVSYIIALYRLARSYGFPIFPNATSKIVVGTFFSMILLTNMLKLETHAS